MKARTFALAGLVIPSLSINGQRGAGWNFGISFLSQGRVVREPH